jgi:predicted RNA-binding Zn ribbon-like protein
MSDGDEAAPAPLPLRWVEELVNTRSVEFGTDEVATPAALARWLIERGLLPADGAVTARDHRRALQVREGMRALIAVNNERAASEASDAVAGIDLSALDLLAALVVDLPLVVDVQAVPPELAPRCEGVDAALARLLAAVAVAVADGSWSRMKVCRDPGCRWAYFDHSRNRSRAWCSMAVCGNRAKARAFRRRGPN